MNIEFAMTEAQHQSITKILFGHGWYRPQDPERGFLAALYVGSGATRRTLLLGSVIEPLEGEVFWSATRGLVMTHRYYSRALTMIKKLPGAGLINVHSHPRPTTTNSPPQPSEQDLSSDLFELGAASRILGENRALAAAIISAGGGISVREYQFKIPSTLKQALKFGRLGPSIRFADRLRIVGPGLRLQEANPTRAAAPRGFDPEATESSILLWGQRGQRLLAELCIGIAGLGGVGGIVAEYLARLGVGKLVLVDYDRLSLGNFNRSQGARRTEAAREVPKVDVYRRVARESATARGFKVAAHRMSISETDGLSRLLDCDLIVGSADDAMARQVLDHAAYAHLIPVIDGGTTLLADPETMRIAAGKSQAAAAAPAHPCLECQGVYTQEEATAARESATWGKYVDIGQSPGQAAEEEVRAPSVICTNSLVASLITLRVLSIALGTTPGAVTGLQRYYVESGYMRWGANGTCKPNCPKLSMTGQGDAHFIPTGVDLRWKQMRENEQRKDEASSETWRGSS